MPGRPTSRRRALVAGLATLAGVAGVAKFAIGSDHQDTPFVELNPKTDLTDVYAFPGASGRTVLAMDTRAFLTPAQATDPAQASFDTNLLYQFKIDIDGDAKEDKVIQVTFTGEGANQKVEVRGPLAPPVQGAMENEVADVTPAVTGAAQHRARRADRNAGVRRAARRSILHRPRGGLLHSAGPPAGDGTAVELVRTAAQRPGAILLPRPRRQLRRGIQCQLDRHRAAQRLDRRQCARPARHLGHHQPVTTNPTRTPKEFTMQLRTFAFATRRLALAAGVAAVSLAATACSDNNDGTGPTTPRMFNQVQRLGNPLVSEVLLSKRDHPTHGSIGPDQDAALVAPQVVDFLTTVAGRDPAYISAIAPALIPDVLVVDTSKDPSTSSWLSTTLSGGWGGRQLQDDVVDLALTAVFGSTLGDAAHATPQLTTDNVAFDSPNVTATFPYLAPPN